jgi:hypothetical protein
MLLDAAGEGIYGVDAGPQPRRDRAAAGKR